MNEPVTLIVPRRSVVLRLTGTDSEKIYTTDARVFPTHYDKIFKERNGG